MERVTLTRDTRVLNHRASIGLEAAHGAPDVPVYFDDFLDGGGFQEGGGDAFLYPEDYARGGADPDCGAAEFDGFEGVFYLEEAAFGGEGAVGGLVGGKCRGTREMCVLDAAVCEELTWLMLIQ